VDRRLAGARFCSACGVGLSSNRQAVVSPGQPPTPVASVPPAVPAWPPQVAPPLDPPASSATPAQFAPPHKPAVAPPSRPASGGGPFPGGYSPPKAPSPQPWYVTAGPDGAAAAGYDTGSPSGSRAARPIGIVILTIVEIVVSLVGLTVVVDLLYWAGVSSYYREAEAGIDLVMGMAYLATSIAGFALAWGLWSLHRWAWMATCLLSIVLLGFDVFSMVEWGVTGPDIIGVTVHLSVLSY